VPALLLQPLAENAIRHGLEPSGQSGRLRIAGVRDGNWLRLTVEDNGVGLPTAERHREGVGLANVRERLATLHADAHEFEIAARPEGGVVVKITLPARTELMMADAGAPSIARPGDRSPCSSRAMLGAPLRTDRGHESGNGDNQQERPA
jgi:hypothetical protein